MSKYSARKILILLQLFLGCSLVYAQHTAPDSVIVDTVTTYSRQAPKLGNKRLLDIFYNWYYPGRNISVQYVHYWGRHALTGGIKYHINGKDNLTSYAFRNKFYADPVIEHIGVSIGYQFDFKRTSSTQKPAVNPFMFASIQYGFLGTRRSYQILNPDNPPNLMTVTEYFDNFFVFEYTIGVGITAKLHNRWHLNGGAGFSLARFRPNFIPSANTVFNGRDPITEGAFIYRIGLSYLLK